MNVFALKLLQVRLIMYAEYADHLVFIYVMCPLPKLEYNLHTQIQQL